MKFNLLALSFVLTLAAAAPAGANMIAISNVPGSGSYDKPKLLSTTNWEAVGLTTDASSQNFSGLVGVFAGGTTGGTLEGGIYSDSGFNKPSTLLSAFNNVPVTPFVTAQVLVTTSSLFQFQPSTKYWFVLHDFTPFAWMADNSISGTTPGVTPGYSYNGFADSSNAGGSWATDNINYTVQISTSAVVAPEPSTLALMAAGALGMAWVARRRKATK